MSEFLQYIFSGLTIGFIYAIVGLGFVVIYNSSKIINFSQGEFIMAGGMISVFLYDLDIPLIISFLIAIVMTSLLGVLLYKITALSKKPSALSLIIITLGYSIFLRGLVQVVFDKQLHILPAISDNTINIFGAILTYQSILIIVVSLIMMVSLYFLFNKTKIGKAMIATSLNQYAAKLMGIDVKKVLIYNFIISATIASIGGIILTPITSTNYEIGIMLGLKGFCAAIIGGVSNPFGAIFGGVILGVLESLMAGYVSSEYKDAFAFILILFILIFYPHGVLGNKNHARV